MSLIRTALFISLRRDFILPSTSNILLSMSSKAGDDAPPPAAEAPKPAFPEGYTPAAVWAPKELGGAMGAMNKPTAGARSEQELPVGSHDLQLYSLGTPNGQKVTILLEELVDLDPSFEYDAHYVDIFKLEQFGSGFVSVNPNSKIPALMDRSFNPPLRVFESCNILRQ